jgi:hypothetical protein
MGKVLVVEVVGAAAAAAAARDCRAVQAGLPARRDSVKKARELTVAAIAARSMLPNQVTTILGTDTIPRG